MEQVGSSVSKASNGCQPLSRRPAYI